VGLFLAIAVISLVFLTPLIWMMGTSLKPEAQVWEYPPRLIPREFVWENYPVAARQFPFMRSLVNTMAVVVGVMVGRLATSTLVAYSFARVRFPGRDAIFLLVLSTMMIPYHAVLIPQFLLFSNLGWLNSLKPLIVPSFFGGGAFFIFLLRQFFMTIPRDYDDAARIDGCGTFGILWQIIVPMSRPALGTVAIYTFMDTWNDFLAPLIYLRTPDKQTLAIAVQQWQRQIQQVGYQHDWNHIMAICTLVALGPILVFFFAQRHFVQGVVVTGLKG
jgi:ABC-type glycerol-3-phosphate transport system permease component